MANYPLTNSDMAEATRRAARGELCTIPIREDITLTNGTVAKNCLTWGSPSCYRISRVELPGGDIYIGEAI